MISAVGVKLAPVSVEIQSCAASLQVVGRVGPVGAVHCRIYKPPLAGNPEIAKWIVGVADSSVSGPPTTFACAFAAVGATTRPATINIAKTILFN